MPQNQDESTDGQAAQDRLGLGVAVTEAVAASGLTHLDYLPAIADALTAILDNTVTIDVHEGGNCVTFGRDGFRGGRVTKRRPPLSGGMPDDLGN